MAYLNAQADDHGLIEFGCHSYGGLAINDNHPLYTLPGLSVGRDSEESAEDKSTFHFSKFFQKFCIFCSHGYKSIDKVI